MSKTLGCMLLVVSLTSLCGCGSDDDGVTSTGCTGPQCGAAGTSVDAATSDAAKETSSPEAAPQNCAPLADITSLIGGELFFGYSALGTSSVQPGCGNPGSAREVAVSLTSDFTGDLVLSTQHPTTKVDTVLELREQSCEGLSLGCEASTTEGVHGSRLTVQVKAGTRYVALVETSDDDEGIFALGVHRPGVCEGLGSNVNVTAKLLTGERFDIDTSTSTSSVRGSCGGGTDAPEARISFTAPRNGTMVATTKHSKSSFEPVLYVRETSDKGASHCDSVEAERACAASGGLLRFDAHGDRVYDLFIDGASANATGQATVTLGYAANSPATAALQGCSHASIQDQFAILVQSGQAVSVKIDTTDASTAADMRLRIRLPDGTELFEADDEVPCTFAPPKYSCPEHSFTASTAGLYTLEAYVGTSEACADKSLVDYVLTATVDGQPGELILVKDQ